MSCLFAHLQAYEATVHHATRALKVDQENAKAGFQLTFARICNKLSKPVDFYPCLVDICKAYFRRGLAQEALGKTQACESAYGEGETEPQEQS